jgi:hypothetical protein
MTSDRISPSEVPGVRAVAREAAAYAPGEDRPLAGYVAVMATYGTVVAGLTAVARATGRRAPETIEPWDLVLLSLATHKFTRIVTKDSITSPLRAPLVEYAGSQGAGELHENVRGGSPLRHALGELVSCPFCLGVWTSTAFATGRVFAPRATRLVASVFATVACSDFLHFAHAKAHQASEG